MRDSKTFKSWIILLALGHAAFAPASRAGDTYCENQSLFSDKGSHEALTREFSGTFLSLPRPAVIPAGLAAVRFLDEGNLSCKVHLKDGSIGKVGAVDTRLLYLERLKVVPLAQGSLEERVELRWDVSQDPAVSAISCSVKGTNVLGRLIDDLDRKLRILHLPEQARLERNNAGQCSRSAGLAFVEAKDADKAPAKEVAAILEAGCAGCHKDGDGDQGGFGSLRNTENLVAKRIVIPGDPAGSPLYQDVQSDRMPATGKPLTAEQKEAVKAWIQGLPAQKQAAKLIKNEEVVQGVLADLAKQSKASQPFMRYFRFDGLMNAGVPADKIARYKEALGKLVNGLSWKKDIYLPENVDPQGRFVRIDLRKLGWSQAVWEKIQNADPLKFQGDAAFETARKELSKLSASEDPIVRTDWFLANGTRPPLYHDILALPSTLGELEKLLAVDTAKAKRESDFARSGFANSGVSQNNRIIERYDSQYGAYWKSLDYASSNGRENIFAHPLDSTPAGGEVIFNLPNGSQAYVLADAQGKRINKAPVEIVSDPSRPDRSVENGISCFSCHFTGLLPKDDEILRASEQAFAAKAISEKDIETIRELHVKPEELRARMDKDSRRYQSALAEISERAAREDVLTPLIQAFEGPVTLASAASDLGVDPDTLVKAIQGALGEIAELGPLATGNCEVSRPVYEKNVAKLEGVLKTGKAAPRLKAAQSPRAGIFIGSKDDGCFKRAAVTPTEKNGRIVALKIIINNGALIASLACDPAGTCTGGAAGGGTFITLQILKDGSLKISYNDSAACSNNVFRPQR